MERVEFIAEAKKLGIEDSDIQSRLELSEEFAEEFANEGIAFDFQLLLDTLKEVPTVDVFTTGSPAPAVPA